MLGWMVARHGAGEGAPVESDHWIGAEGDGRGDWRLIAPPDVWDAAQDLSARLATGASPFTVTREAGVPMPVVAAFVEGLSL